MRVNWNNPKYQRYFLDKIAKQLNMKSHEDWYSMTNAKFTKLGGGSLLTKYNSNFFNILKANYPEYEWDDLKRKSLPQKFLKTIENQRLIMDNFAKENNINEPADWYKVKVCDIRKTKGLGVIFRYKGIMEMLRNVYPEYEWDEMCKENHSRHYWKSLDNRRSFFERVFHLKGLKRMDDWYKISIKDIKLLGGGALMKLYNDSLYGALLHLYPEYPWDLLKSKTKSKLKFFMRSDLRELKHFYLLLQRKFLIQKQSDWFRLSASQIYNEPGGPTICKLGVVSTLKLLFPTLDWISPYKKTQEKKSTQRWLWVTVTRLFPFFPIFENYRHPKILFKESMCNIEIDIFLPSFNLGFEFNGAHHYDDIPSVFTSIEVCQDRDIEKYSLCNIEKVHLITIPYWWDQSVDSLREYLRGWKFMQNI